MIIEDPILRLIYRKNFPIFRGEITVKNFLKDYYRDYISDLKSALSETYNRKLSSECYELIDKHINVIEVLCGDIIKVFDLYNSGRMKELYPHFHDMMCKIERFIIHKKLTDKQFDWYKSLWRIRSAESSEQQFNRSDIFHIPMSKREWIKPYRYSISGYPCLYLAGDLELCWYECGMPKQFYYSNYSFYLNKGEEVSLVDFSILSIELISSIKLQYLNNPESTDDIDNNLLNYLITIPLRAACSLAVKNRDIPFIEEYIFPQQLLLWIRENDNFDGIIYRSSSTVKSAWNLNSANIVMPAKAIKGDYSERLNNLFLVTKPQKQTIKENVNDDTKVVDDFILELQSLSISKQMCYSVSPFKEMISMCQDYINLCGILLSENYSNTESVHHSIKTLKIMSDFLCQNLEKNIEEYVEIQSSIIYNLDKKIIRDEIKKISSIYRNKISPIISGLEIHIRPFEVDYNSGENPIQNT